MRRPTQFGSIASHLDPGQALSVGLPRWPVLVLFATLGALFGLGFSFLQPPLYKAEAVMAVSIDYGRTAPLELIVEDRLLDRVWAYLTSAEVLQGATDRLADTEGSNRSTTVAELRENTRLEARLSRWHFIGSAGSPEEAAAIANAWAESAAEALENALKHAWRAVELQDGVLFPNCIQVLHGPTQDELWECFSRGSNVDPGRIEEVRAEIAAAHGVSPMISYDSLERAVPASAPSAYDQGVLVLAGALIGVIAGVGGLLFVPALRRG